MIPVPDHPTVDTPYGRRGHHWSCDENAAGEGIHTGVDYAAPAGALVVAARPGDLVHCHFGSAFGAHQVAVWCDDGTRDFYAHMRYRVEPCRVRAGDMVGQVGAEGNATGPHLHFERHTSHSAGWSCGVVTDPQPSIDWSEEMTENEWQRLQGMLDATVEKVWNEHIEVTKPGSGAKTEMKARQVLRETWQKITKAT
jgi:murein DD-endopeptidase MepM/ murein hydrolase activator NlpD